MKLPFLVVIGLAIALGAFVVVRLGSLIDALKKLAEGASPSSPALPPALPRRGRRAGNPSGGSAVVPAETESSVTSPVPPAHLDAGDLQVARPARAQPRAQFFGRSALRQAIVAREVLGPPLSLRPPRF